MKQPILQNPVPQTPLSRILLRFLLAGMLSAARIFDGYAPFSLGFVAAAGGGLAGLSALAGAVTGAALSMDFSHILRFSAVGILLFSASMSLSGDRLKKNPLLFPCVAALLTASVEAVYLFNSKADFTEVTMGLTYVVLTGLSAYYFPDTDTLFRWDTPQAKHAHLALLACLLDALHAVPLPLSLSLGRIGGGTFVMALAFTRGAFVGAAAGLGIGLLSDLALGGRTLYFTAAYALAAFFLGFQRKTGKPLAAALYGLVLLFFLLPASPSYRLSVAYEFLFSSLFFFLLPLRKQGGKRLVQTGSGTGETRLRTQIAETAQAFRELSASFPRTAEGEESPAVLFDRTAERICRDCTLSGVCWNRDYETTYNAFTDATPALLRRGEAKPADFPRHFSSRCIRFSDFLDTLNAELVAFLQRKQYRSRLHSARELARGQYAELSELLARTAEASAVPVSLAAPCAYRVGSASRPRRGECVSGDSLRTFESDDRRRLFLLLSDGMGTGEAAQKESATAVRLLERFLKAGIPTDAALKTLHGAMTLRSEETGAFTTVDLLSLDLTTGDATLYKYGAAPSYLREGQTVRRIRSRNFPVGLGDDAAPDATGLSLASGTVLVLTSDGIAERDGERWLSALLRDWRGHDPQTLADKILAESLSHGGGDDDCAALTLYLPPKEEKV